MLRLLLPFFVALLFGTSAFGQGAVLSFNETTHDFGKVPLDSPLRYSFEFSNTGNQMLIITGIEPSCHCVAASWTRGAIMPGTKGTVDVVYTAPLDEGKFNRGFMIASNATNVDPSLLRFELRIMGEAIKDLPKKKGTLRTKRRKHGITNASH